MVLIDLVYESEGRYYVLDWKSNYLGPDASHYAELSEAMISHDYVLQYHIYILALHLSLKNRIENYDYDEHIGGAIYVFLRGVNPNGHEGWYFHKPPKSLI